MKPYTIPVRNPPTATVIHDTRRGRIARMQRDARARRLVANEHLEPPDRPVPQTRRLENWS